MLLTKFQRIIEHDLKSKSDDWQKCSRQVIEILVSGQFISESNKFLSLCLLGPYIHQKSNGKTKKVIVGKADIPQATKFLEATLTKDGTLSYAQRLFEVIELFDTMNENFLESNIGLLLTCTTHNGDPIYRIKVLKYISKVSKNLSQHSKVKLDVLKNFIKSGKFNLNIDFLHPTSDETLQLKLFEELIMMISSPDTFTVAMDLLKKFFERFCGSLNDKLEFLSLFFITDRLGMIVSPEIQFTVVKIVGNILSKRGKDVAQLSLPILLRFILGCNVKYYPVRKAAVENLKQLTEVKTGSLQILISHLIEAAQEIILDPEQLPLVLFSINQINKKSKEKLNLQKITNNFLSVATDKNTHQYERAAILELLKHINDPAILEQLIEIVNDLLDSFVDFDNQDSMVLKHIVNKINPDLVRYSNKNEKVYELLSKLIRNTQQLDLRNRKLPLAALTLRVLDRDTFVAANEKTKSGIFKDVIEVASNSSDPAIQYEVTKFLKQITISSKYIIELFKKFCEVKEFTTLVSLVSKNVILEYKLS